jgi:hypothetical protein
MNMLYHFITLTEDVYDAQYRVTTQLIQDNGRHLRRSGILRRDMSRAMEEHCFNEEHLPLSGLATFSAAQDLNPKGGAFDVEPMSVSERPEFSIKQLKRLIKNEEDAKLEL